MTNKLIPLAGQWKRLVDDEPIDFVTVPGSYRPVGESTLEFAFGCPWDKPPRRLFLVTEGVLSRTSFALNGTHVGDAGPFSRYRFEIDPALLQNENVGFRRIEISGSDFFVNGTRTILKGVNRHELTSASGYSPSEEELRREIALIRHAGFNYIRLVHSPQSAHVSRVAAEIGIFVSEEPVACFHDLADPKAIEPALDCLGRMVRRDRNVPSIFAWLIYNECNPNVAYAVRAAAICRADDPDRFVSMADCSCRHDEIREMVREANLSYYGINLYSTSAADFRKTIRTSPS